MVWRGKVKQRSKFNGAFHIILSDLEVGREGEWKLPHPRERAWKGSVFNTARHLQVL